MNYLLAHPALLLWAFPFVLAAAVKGIASVEKAVFARLFELGDPVDQKAVRATAAIWVQWAEAKAGPAADGSSKFVLVDKLLARALPFLSADQRKSLIEQSVSAMDAAAQAALIAGQDGGHSGGK
jgi:hypothetical protein